MSLERLRALLYLTLLALIVPLLAACGGDVATVAPTGLPTTAIATTVPTTGGEVATTGGEVATSAPQPNPTPDAQPTAAPTTSTDPSLEPGTPMRFKNTQYGIVNHLYYTDRDRVLTLNGIAGFTWVRQQVVWKDIEDPLKPGSYAWSELDNIIPDVTKSGQKLLVSVVRSPSSYNPTNGLPSDPKALGNFVEAMAKRYGDQITAYEIWNEPNLAIENGGRVTPEDAGKYVEILAECYKRIKAVSPGAFVVAAPPSSSGVNDPTIAVSDENYYRAMYEYKGGMIKNFFDAQGVHPGGSANPPDTMWPDNPSVIDGCVYTSPTTCWNTDPTFYFRHVENVKRFMDEEGVGDHQIWITEYGWATNNDTRGYEFGKYVSFDQQAQYIVGAMKLAQEKYRDPEGKPWIGAMFLWNMNYAVLTASEGNPNNEQGSFGILNADYSPRQAFIAIQGYLSEIKGKNGS